MGRDAPDRTVIEFPICPPDTKFRGTDNSILKNNEVGGHSLLLLQNKHNLAAKSMSRHGWRLSSPSPSWKQACTLTVHPLEYCRNTSAGNKSRNSSSSSEQLSQTLDSQLERAELSGGRDLAQGADDRISQTPNSHLFLKSQIRFGGGSWGACR